MRIELTYKGFADLSLTTWVPRPGHLTLEPLQKFVQTRAYLHSPDGGQGSCPVAPTPGDVLQHRM